jgi:hypothetical protein
MLYHMDGSGASPFSEFLVLENVQWWEAYTQGQRENGRTEHGCSED